MSDLLLIWKDMFLLLLYGMVGLVGILVVLAPFIIMLFVVLYVATDRGERL